jgi:hypothetical protein
MLFDCWIRNSNILLTNCFDYDIYIIMMRGCFIKLFLKS